MKICKYCKSTSLEWSIEAYTNSTVPNGRYTNHDFFVQMYQGCIECGETLEIIQHADKYNSKEVKEAISILGEIILKQ